MVGGFWLNQDGLPLQFGTQKAIPEVGGDFLYYGENREVEQIIPLVPTTYGSGVQIPAPAQTSFLGTSTPAAAGIISLTHMFPLQITAPNTGGTTITLVNTQLMIEQVEVVPLITATGGTSISVGLVTTSEVANAGANPGAFVQVTPNAGVQVINGLLTAAMTTAAGKITWTAPGAVGTQNGAVNVAGGGTWIGINTPLVTNTLTPLPTDAFLSTIQAGTFTNGLIKLRVKYFIYGAIAY